VICCGVEACEEQEKILDLILLLDGRIVQPRALRAIGGLLASEKSPGNSSIPEMKRRWTRLGGRLGNSSFQPCHCI
jgi:hypothetical protein